MAAPTIPARPGFWGQLSYPGERQRIKVGTWLDMSQPDKAWKAALEVQYSRLDRDLTLRVLPVKNSEVTAVQTIRIKDFMPGLAGLEVADEPISQPATMPDYYSPSAPQQQQVQVVRPMPTAQEPPANMDHYGQFLFRQQEARLLEARNSEWELREKLRIAEDEKRKLKDQLDETKIELRYKDREHQHNLEDERRKIRDEYEDQEPKPSGLAGLTEVMTNPAHPMAGLVGLLATKLLGGAPGAPAAGGAQLGDHSDNMVQILNGLAELIPNDEYGTKLYTSLARILPRPDGLQQLQQLAAQGSVLAE